MRMRSWSGWVCSRIRKVGCTRRRGAPAHNQASARVVLRSTSSCARVSGRTGIGSTWPNLAPLRGRSTRAADECRRSHNGDARARREHRVRARAAARRGTARVAGRTIARRVDARRLHRLTRVLLRRLRARAGRVGTYRGLTYNPDVHVRFETVRSRGIPMTNVDLVRLAGSRARISATRASIPSPPR